MRRFGAKAALFLTIPAMAGIVWLATRSVVPGLVTVPVPVPAPLAVPVPDASVARPGPGPASAKNSSVSHLSLPDTTRTVKPRNDAVSAERATPTMAGGTSPGTTGSDTGTETAVSESEILAKIQAGEPGYEVLASRLELGSAPLVPRWAEGDEWTVETLYRQMQAPGEVWSDPRLWRFRIEREVGYRDRPCYEFSVARMDEPGYEPAVYYVTRDTYRLAGAETTVQEKSKLRRVTSAPPEDELAEPGAVRAPFSIVPFDLPAVGTIARRVPAGLDFLREPGGPALPASALARIPRAEDLLGAGGQYLDVTYESPHDGTAVRQRWSAADARWPVISKTETTLSFRRR